MKYRLGIDIGATKTKILLLNSQGKILQKTQIPTQSFGAVEPIIERAGQEIEKILTRHRIKKNQLPMVGVGLAGQLNPKTGYVDNSPNLKWFGLQFGKKFEKRLGIKIRLANDVNAAAWGEFLYGAGKGCENLVAVFVGSGIGGGIVVNSRLVEGASGTAGEVGHMIFRENGLLCDCGHRGCHEVYAGGVPMENRMRKAVKQGKSPLVEKMVGGELSKINTRTIYLASQQGDRVARKIWNDAVMSLGVLCANLVSLLNPEVLVLGGGVVKGNPELVRIIKDFIAQRAVELSAQKVKVVKSRLMGDAVALGAAGLAELELRR